MMNIHTIVEVANWLKEECPLKEITPFHNVKEFGMLRYFESIPFEYGMVKVDLAGAILSFYEKPWVTSSLRDQYVFGSHYEIILAAGEIQGRAAWHLGITPEISEALFLPSSDMADKWLPGGMGPEEITPGWALRVLEHLHNTGTVNWRNTK